MIHIAIVEDEASERDLLSTYIHKFANENQIEVFLTEYTDGIDIIHPYQGGFDLIFLDIQMAFMDGITTAQAIREQDENVIIIFITLLAQYAINGYTVGATNFLVKPLTYFAFQEEFKSALRKIENKQKNAVLLHNDQGFIKISLADIYFIETIGRSLRINTRSGDLFVNESLSNIEKRLDDSRFFRCHRAYLVNLFFVERVLESDIIVRAVRIPVSRYKRKGFEEALIKVIGENL